MSLGVLEPRSVAVRRSGLSKAVVWLAGVPGVMALAWLAARDLRHPNPLFHPHGFCYLWESDLVGTHVAADVLIAVSYLTISLTLVVLVRRTRRAIPFSWMLLAFGTFIVACGATHAMEVVTLWKPLFWMSADVKIVTALASVLTAVALPPLIPRIVGVVAAAQVSEARRVALERANEALEADVSERKQMQQQLESSVREKELLLKEVHHRVKNNLAVISSLFYLQSTYTPDRDVIRMFEDSQNRVRSMALVHETLYGSQSFGSIDFGDYARVLSGQLQAAYNPSGDRVRIELDTDRVALSIDLAVPCGLILNELISNAFKHAFPGDSAGVIAVSVRSTPDRLGILEVVDNGVGRSPDDPTVSTSLGLRLVASLTKQIRGTFALSARERGLAARLVFPLDEHTEHAEHTDHAQPI